MPRVCHKGWWAHPQGLPGCWPCFRRTCAIKGEVVTQTSGTSCWTVSLGCCREFMGDFLCGSWRRSTLQFTDLLPRNSKVSGDPLAFLTSLALRTSLWTGMEPAKGEPGLNPPSQAQGLAVLSPLLKWTGLGWTKPYSIWEIIRANQLQQTVEFLNWFRPHT